MEATPRKSRFYTHRAIFIGVHVLAVCGVGASIWRDRVEAIDNGAREARNLSVVLSGQIERSIQSVDIGLRGLRRRIDDLDTWTPTGPIRIPNPAILRKTLLEQLNLLPQAFQIAVAGQDGQLLLSTAAWPTPDINVADREYFRDLRETYEDRLSISLPFPDPVTHEPTVVLARRISGPDGAFSGVLFASVKRSYFENVYGTVDALPNQTFNLLRRDGTLLIRFPDPRDRVGEKIPPEFEFHAAVRDGRGFYRSSGAFDGVTRWVGASPLKEYPLVVTMASPESLILANWRMRTTAVLLGTVVFSACALFLLYIMTRQYRRLGASEAALEHEHANLLEKEAALSIEHTALVMKEADLEKEHAALVEKEMALDAAINNISQGLVMFDAVAKLVVCNTRYAEMYGFSPEDVRLGSSLAHILRVNHRSSGFPADPDKHLQYVLASAAKRESATRDVRCADGRVIQVTRHPMSNGGWVATHEDITVRRENEMRVSFLAQNDPLTGVANRSFFLEQIGHARERLKSKQEPFAILMLDLDHFKHVNDSLGHAAGDALLKETARRLQASTRSLDVVGRIGGDEFAILQTVPREFEAASGMMTTMREHAIILATRIIELISEPFDIDGQKFVIGTSIGIALAPEDAIDPDALMKKADLALYKAKSEGRNSFSFFDVEMESALTRRQQLEADLRKGLFRDEFELYFQPIVAVSNRQPCCMEALVRWNHPDHGLITPDRFISVAEDTGLIMSLGEWIIELACAEAAKWPGDVKVSVNISPVQFRTSNLFDVIMQALADSGLPPDRLEIEITERVLLEDLADHLAVLHQLRSVGVSIALDDFGTGYSSLSYLNKFPFDKIKIDRSFTNDFLERPDCAAIMCAIINLGRSLDIETTAEGVETERQFQALRATGLSQAQGYLFGRPVPASGIRFVSAMSYGMELRRSMSQ